jgi:hypothetical protein
LLKQKNNKTQKTTLEVDEIKQYFPFHRVCVVKTLLFLVSCILQANNCDLNKAKNKGSVILGKTIDAEIMYIRFIRFFKIKHKEAFVIGILRLIHHFIRRFNC